MISTVTFVHQPDSYCCEEYSVQRRTLLVPAIMFRCTLAIAWNVAFCYRISFVIRREVCEIFLDHVPVVSMFTCI